ncbi:hypothetical protein [Streptomyces sp. NPDC049040]|uniref:hypothetical protein n=1 Tax=Streptomyces sp. NPDC049040 TaxID=3365593 RepID=UPI00371D8897
MTAVRWGLIATERRGVYHNNYEPRVLEEVTGTREEALARLEQVLAEYIGDSSGIARRRLYRTDDGFLYVHGDGMQTDGTRFSIAELISDSNDAKLAAAAEKEAAKQRKAAERRARREQRRMPIEDDPEDR